MLQNQRQTKNLYRIDSNQNLYKIILEVFTKKQLMFTWYFLMWRFWFCSTYEFALSDFFLWKVLDFVETNILVWRAEVDLVMIFLYLTLGPSTESGGPAPPPNCKGDFIFGLGIVIKFKRIQRMFMVVSKFGATSLADLLCWMPPKHLKNFDVWLGKLIRCEGALRMIRLGTSWIWCWEKSNF